MSDLPTGWVQAPLDEIADVLDYEREPVNSSERENRIAGKPQSDLYPYFGATGQVGLIDSFRSEGERVLLGEDAAPFLDPTKDKAYLATGRFWVNNHAHVLRGAGGLVDNRFLCHQLNVVDYHSFVTGSTRLKLTSTAMRRIPLVLAPAREQARIVAKLEELLSDLDAGVAELKAAQKKLQQYRQSLLKAAVEGALTADWREAQRQQGTPTETGAQLLARILTERRARWEARQLAKFKEQGKAPPKDWQKKYPEPVQPDTAELPALPEGWAWATVDQLGDVQLGRQRSPDKLKGVSPTRYIRAANITENGIDFSDVLEMDFSEQERETFRLRTGDVLLTEASGSAEHVGRPAVWPNVEGLYCFQNTVLRFMPRGISSHFAFYAFLGMQKLGVFSRLSGGVGINHLSAGKFSKLAIALPPCREQEEVVKALDSQLAALDEQASQVETSLNQTSAQRQGILRAAFAGQLVPQDPNEEPAVFLLERIRSERAKQSKRPKVHRSKQGKEIAVVANTLIDVLAEVGDWVSAQEAFRRCGVADGVLTERIEELYDELRKLDKAGRLEVEAVTDTQGRKLHDRIRLRVI